ncbi:MAG TPA: hypothetical protein VF152_15905 [Acidimicrobiia bacterium]
MDAVAAVRRHGILLQSAHGPVPNLASLVAGEPIQGSWWGHPRNHEIFRAINQARESSVVVATHLVGGKVTLIHRRLWPAVVRLSNRFDDGALDAVHEEHTESGLHRTSLTPFPDWVPDDVRDAARALGGKEALAQLPPAVQELVVGTP